jgi:cellulose synthase operon protein C
MIGNHRMSHLVLPLRFGVTAISLALLAGCGSKADRLESGLKKGAEFVHLADWDKANLEVRNVLQIDPKNARAYVLAGQVAEGKREITRAFGSYQKAVELDPQNTDAKLGIAKIYLLAGETDKADKASAELLAADSTNLTARTLQAAVLAKRGSIPEAITQAKALIAGQKTAPVDASVLLAGLLMQQGDAAQAMQVVEKALEGSPGDLGLLMIAAQVAAEAQGSADLAAKAPAFYKRATESAPKNADLWTAWALHHVRRNELDAAEGVLRESVRAQPSDERRTLALLDFLGSRRGVAIAEKEYLAAIDAKPKDTRLRFGLVGLYRAANRNTDAQRVLKEIVELDKEAPGSLTARNQLAAQALAVNRVAEARGLLEEVLKRSPRDADALVMRGRLLLGEGKAADAVIDLRSAAKDKPGSAEIAGLLAQAHRAAGEPQLTREVLADAVKFKPDDPALRLLLAADMADSKEFGAAHAELDEAIRLAPKAARGYEAKAQLAASQRDFAGAEKALVALKQQLPNDTVGYLRLGQLHASQRKYEAALKEYDAAARRVPTDPTPVLSAVGLLIGERKFDAAAARIDAYAQADPKNVLIQHQLRGELALARRDLGNAEAAYRQLVAAAPTIPNGYQSLARVMMLRNDVPGAMAVFDAGEKAIPAEPSLPLARAEWLTRAGRYDEAISIYETLLQRDPANDAVTNNLAYLLTEIKGDRPSLERALQLAGRFEGINNSGYLDSLGWVHYRLGQYDRAVLVLERAVALSNAPLLQLHLGMALHKNGDPKRGSDLLRKALESKAMQGQAKPPPLVDEARKLVAQG